MKACLLTKGSCLSAGYTSCCEEGPCRGRDFVTGGTASCTCDLICGELGTCCSDVVLTCPDSECVCVYVVYMLFVCVRQYVCVRDPLLRMYVKHTQKTV